MLVRFPLLLALLLSLAFGPARMATACAPAVSSVSCHSCCSELDMACCSAADHSAPANAPDAVVPQAADGKLFISPHFVSVGFRPLPVVERPAFQKLQEARMPAPPRVRQTCIRLI
jgi:hypothetical protein